MGKQTILVIAMTEVRDAGSPALVLDPISFVAYRKEVLLQTVRGPGVSGHVVRESSSRIRH